MPIAECEIGEPGPPRSVGRDQIGRFGSVAGKIPDAAMRQADPPHARRRFSAVEPGGGIARHPTMAERRREDRRFFPQRNDARLEDHGGIRRRAAPEAGPKPVGPRRIVIARDQPPSERRVLLDPPQHLMQRPVARLGRVEDIPGHEDIRRAAGARGCGECIDGIQPRFPQRRRSLVRHTAERLADLPIRRV